MPASDRPARAGPRLAAVALAAATCWLAVAGTAAAHHVLGRPSYSLNEDSNTPSSMSGEEIIGDYMVTYMVFPAFPKPGGEGRLNVYAARLDDAALFDGEVTFSVRDDTWTARLGLGDRAETLGVQRLDDGVYRQAFQFTEAGDYMITASFEANGEPYIVEFPLRVGAPSAFGPIGIAVGVIAAVLLVVTLIQRRRTMTGKIRSAHERPH